MLNNKFEFLIDSLTTAVLVLDENIKISYANLAAQSMLEQSNKQLLGNHISQVVVRSNVDIDQLKRAIEKSEGFSDSEVVLTIADGRHVLADITVNSVDGIFEAALLVEIKLIDQQKRISQESQQWAQQQAARELIRGLAHEIKNPLGGIRGAAQLLQKQLASLDLKEYTQVIIEQSDRLRNLVDRLLGPNSVPSFESQNIHRMLEKVRMIVQLDTSHDIEIIRDYDPSIPDIYVDSDMLQQTFLNIVRNSLQALQNQSVPGRIEFRTRIKRQFTIHGVRHPLAAQIKIIDNGPGIPEDIKDTLFYPMVTGNVNGTGLGLSIAQTLIHHHKGKIEVESWPGHTEFKIYLPIEKKESTR